MGRHWTARVDRPERMRSQRLSGVDTRVWTDKDGNTHLRYHRTDVVSFNNEWITLRTGGWNTVTTRERMNRAAYMFDLQFTVFTTASKEPRVEGDPRRRPGDWWIEYQGKWPFTEHTVSLNRKTSEMVEEDMVKPASDICHTKRAKRSNPSRNMARNIAPANSADDIDVEVTDEGSIILFKLVTDAAKTWWFNNVQSGQQFGGRFVVEHRYADTVIQGMMADGLNVR